MQKKVYLISDIEKKTLHLLTYHRWGSIKSISIKSKKNVNVVVMYS
jgi:hypothetical protein